MRPVESTKFLTRARKKIFMSTPTRGSKKQVFFTITNAGEKRYAPKAYFAQNKVNNNTTVRTIKAQNKVPNKLAPKAMPKGNAPKKNNNRALMSPEQARRARMNAMAKKRAAGTIPVPRKPRAAGNLPVPRKPRAAPKKNNWEAKSTARFRRILNKKAPVRKPRAAPKKNNWEAKSTAMFGRILNKKAPVRKPRAAPKKNNWEAKSTAMFGRILGKKAPVRKPRAAPKNNNWESMSTAMFGRILNKKAPVRKPRAAPKKNSSAMKLLLKINAENRRILARNNALIAKSNKK
jgi:hypothetical protein